MSLSALFPVQPLLHTVVQKGTPQEDDNSIPLIFVHGAGSSSHTWRQVLPHFQEQTCYAIDLRGHGHSELGDDMQFSLETLSQDLIEFCKSQNLSKAIWVAHSMGARIAVAAAAMKPEFFQGLLLVDMEMRPHPTKPLSASDLATLKLFQRTYKSEDEMREVLHTFGYTDDRIDSLIKERRIEKGLSEVRVWVNPYTDALCQERIWNNLDCEGYFQQISQLPMALLRADRESEVSDEGCAWMQCVHPQMQVVTIPDSDHRIHKTALELFIREVKAFYHAHTSL